MHRWAVERLGDEVEQQAPVGDLRVDPEVAAERAGDGVYLVDEKRVAVGEEVDPRHATNTGEHRYLRCCAAQLSLHLGLDLRREVALGACHPRPTGVLVRVAEDLGARCRLERLLDRRQLHVRVQPYGDLQIEQVGTVGLDHHAATEVGVGA